MKRPNSKAHLDAAIQRLAAAQTYDSLFIEIRTLVANVVVGQLLPDCVIKGGSALKLRYGRRQTRFTLDFDAASRMERKSFIEAMRENLANGWCDFTGTMEWYDDNIAEFLHAIKSLCQDFGVTFEVEEISHD